MDRTRFNNFLVLSLIAATCGIGCGRRGDRASLLPRVNVTEIMEEGSGPASGAQSEQYVNSQIDAELRRKKSDVADAADHVLASAKEGVQSWKKVLPGSRKSKSSPEFGKDPFLDTIDEIIAKDASTATESARQAISESVDRTLDQLTNGEAAEMFADLPNEVDQASQTVANLAQDAWNDTAKSMPESATSAEVFGAGQEDVFGDVQETTRQVADNLQNGLENMSRNGRQGFAEATGSAVHRFDELFDEDSAVQQVGSETTGAIRNVVEAAQLKKDVLTQQFEDTAAEAFTEFNTAVEESFDTATADMFEPPAPTPTPVLPDIPEIPELPEPPALAVAPFEQQDAVVTPNAPRVLPDLAPEPPAVPEMPETELVPEGRIAVGSNDPVFSDPVFSEPVLPDVDEIQEVTIPDLRNEPAPRFTVTEPERPTLTARPVTVVTNNVRPATLTNTPATASVLPDVDWQGRQATEPRTLRAPSEWTAWFLMGGAALIILLLFAPSRHGQ